MYLHWWKHKSNHKVWKPVGGTCYANSCSSGALSEQLSCYEPRNCPYNMVFIHRILTLSSQYNPLKIIAWVIRFRVLFLSYCIFTCIMLAVQYQRQWVNNVNRVTIRTSSPSNLLIYWLNHNTPWTEMIAINSSIT